jgi:hypothetical protein
MVALLTLLCQAFVFETTDSDVKNNAFGTLIAIILIGTFVLNVVSLMTKMIKKNRGTLELSTEDRDEVSKEVWKTLFWMHSFLKLDNGNSIVFGLDELKKRLASTDFDEVLEVLKLNDHGTTSTTFEDKNLLATALRLSSSRSTSSEEAIEKMLTEFLSTKSSNGRISTPPSGDS